jgi:hypothetical protein
MEPLLKSYKKQGFLIARTITYLVADVLND